MKLHRGARAIGHARNALLLGALTLVGAAAPAPLLSVTLEPGVINTEAGTGHIDVELAAEAADTPAGAPLLTMPIVVANTDTVAGTLQDLLVSDARGPVPLTVRDDSEAIAYSRHWIAGRDVKGTLVIRYRAPVDNTPPVRGSGPPYGLRTEGGGVSGAGMAFLLLPETQRPYRLAIRWKLAALGAGATGTSSYGDGDVVVATPGPAGRLSSSVFMAGPLRREPRGSAPGFSSAWLGEPPFDPRPLMRWTHRLHGWMSGFFRDAETPPYRVFARFNPINAGGGAALTNSFLVTYGRNTDPEDLKGTLAHEMVHTWTGSTAGQWYGEGIAVHYQALLPWRARLITTAEFLEDLNQTAARYYANPLNDTPNAEIAPHFWEDSRIRVLPYDRGGLYFAVLDGRIRDSSGGRRSLDDLVRVMVDRRRKGETTDEAAWLALVTGELGEPGRALHGSMLAGGLMLPDSDDFGPCFRRTTGRIRRFELGFDPKSLVGAVKTIRGLKAGSEAAKAGLRDGDVVTYAAAIDGIQGDPKRTLTLQVTRNGRTFPLTYPPRGEVVDIWQWARAPGVPESACRY